MFIAEKGMLYKPGTFARIGDTLVGQRSTREAA